MAKKAPFFHLFIKKVRFTLNIPAEFGIITITIEMAEDGGQVARAFVSADTSHKPLFGKKGNVLNLCHLYFNIVSDFVLRFSYFAGLGISTLVERSLQIHLFMQNKPNFRKSQMSVNSLITADYEQLDTWSIGKNKPKTNPIQTQTNPILANKTPIQTQFKPKQTQLFFFGFCGCFFARFMLCFLRFGCLIYDGLSSGRIFN
ncbi:MAG: hypothetical protein OEW48_12700 [Phycisphaerae bacterium]|nr:hypothetical protein [Phycisphaerae bacterium]